MTTVRRKLIPPGPGCQTKRTETSPPSIFFRTLRSSQRSRTNNQSSITNEQENHLCRCTGMKTHFIRHGTITRWQEHAVKISSMRRRVKNDSSMRFRGRDSSLLSGREREGERWNEREETASMGIQVGLMRLIREKTKGEPRRGHRAGMRVRTNYEEHWRGPSERKLSRLN